MVQAMPVVALRFRIALVGAEPEIWRSIQVPCHYSFWDLHVAIQDAMGWLDCHLHAFRMRNPGTGQVEEIGIPLEDIDGTECLAGWEVPIAMFFMKVGDTSDYSYDFGDDWEHTVTLVDIVEIDDSVSPLACIGGARACPPEDCGGLPGYENLLAILNNPKHPEHHAMTEWISDKFDAEGFDASKVRFDDPYERWKIAFGDELDD